jgi:hypothetical protein
MPGVHQTEHIIRYTELDVNIAEPWRLPRLHVIVTNNALGPGTVRIVALNNERFG